MCTSTIKLNLNNPKTRQASPAESTSVQTETPSPIPRRLDFTFCVFLHKSREQKKKAAHRQNIFLSHYKANKRLPFAACNPIKLNDIMINTQSGINYECLNSTYVSINDHCFFYISFFRSLASLVMLVKDGKVRLGNKIFCWTRFNWTGMFFVFWLSMGPVLEWFWWFCVELQNL